MAEYVDDGLWPGIVKDEQLELDIELDAVRQSGYKMLGSLALFELSS